MLDFVLRMLVLVKAGIVLCDMVRNYISYLAE